MTVPRCPASLDEAQADAALALARAAWRTAGGCGCGRVDLRADAAGRLHVLEVNPNPDLAPSAGLARMAATAGWSYRDLVERMVVDAGTRAAVRRVIARAGDRPDRSAELQIVPLPVTARPAVQRILEHTGMFRDDEVIVALEVVDAYLAHPGQDYTALGAFTRDGELVGYSCHGPTPCTLGTCDLYWIAVDPGAQRAGVGSALLQEVERRLAQEDARLLLIETSGQPRYQATRSFYERHGYHEVARVPEFYAPGDDRVIFAKRIHPDRRG
jgi:ribosomal protein S18 acetylase RimI-like enzyme